MKTYRTIAGVSVLLILVASFSHTIDAQRDNPKSFWDLSDEVDNCETTLVRQDHVVAAFLKETDSNKRLVIIVRLGDKETSTQLAKRRLMNVQRYFATRGSDVPPKRLIFAIGTNIEGFGAVEYYLDGFLFSRIRYPRGSYICHSCCGPDSDYFPYKGRR